MIDWSKPEISQVLIALFTLMNTALVVWAGRKVTKITKQVNGMRHELEESARGEGFRRGRMETGQEIDERRASTHREAMRRGRERMQDATRREEEAWTEPTRDG